MKIKKSLRLLTLLLVFQLVVPGCSPKAEESDPKESEQVASKEEMAEPAELSAEGLKKLSPEQIKDGVYSITVDSSSSMFKITDCQLTVKDGQMQAQMTMSGTGYLYVYMGTGEEAAKAAESDWISFQQTDDGSHTFTVPVAGLNQELDCAAFSKNKEKWYERTLIFRGDSLPVSALEKGVVSTAQTLELADGTYTVEVELQGGSGKASVTSPAKLYIDQGQAYAQIQWSSPNYDYMKVNDVQYLPVNSEGNSCFEIPVEAFDWNLGVIADTVAMSEPHEISYTLYFDSDTIQTFGE